MKKFSKILLRKEYKSPVQYDCTNTDVESYVEICLHFDFKEGLRFSVSVPNMGYCSRNPFTAVLRVLEHESIGMAKYNRLKEDVRAKGFWKKL